MHPPRSLLAAALLAVCAARAASAQTPPPVVLDGAADDWRGVPAALADPADAPGPYADVRAVRVRHDADAVYLALQVERPVALQGMAGTLALLLDEDDDAATGWDVHGMRGVDAAVEFSAALGEGGARMGTGLRRMHAAGRASCVASANVAGIAFAPSHAARWFEIRIPRGEEGVPFGARMRARFVSLDAADAVVDATEAIAVDLRDPAARPAGPGAGAADPLARAPGTDVRVVSWNVGRETMFEHPHAFGALLRPLAPDVLLLDEVAGGHSAAEVEALLDRILPGERPWRAAYGVSGGSQRGVVATRGPAPRLLAPFDRPIPYPDSTRALVPPGDSAAAVWLRSRLGVGIPATGAIVEVDGRRILAVTVDLESGGTPGSAKDRLRRIEAHAIREAAEVAIVAGTGPEGIGGVILAGDLNLVGTREPLDVLAAPVAESGAFTVARPLRLDGASAATWENDEEPFTPGRLDFVLVHPAGMEVAGGFVLRAADLSPEWRARHGVGADASRVTDHLPVVTDLRWVTR